MRGKARRRKDLLSLDNFEQLSVDPIDAKPRKVESKSGRAN